MFATHIAAFVVGAFAVLVIQQLRIDKIEASHKLVVATLVQEHATAAKAQQDQAAKDQSTITTNYEDALNAARTRETLLRVDRDRSRAAADSLRVAARTAASRLHLPETPSAAITEYALSVSELFTDCAGKYQELGEKADGHVSDLRTVTDAWPVLPPK